MSKLIIAIDGFSSCGKSTLARDLATKLGFLYIDSGAMYRAVTLYFLRNKVDLNDETSVNQALDQIDLSFNNRGEVCLNNENVSILIRDSRVSNIVSEVSALSSVRKKLVQLQQGYGQNGNIVMDGRDIGTVVFPHADIKIFLTADPKIRAQRRFEELTSKGIDISLDEVASNLAHRDHIDSTRADSPLRQSKDAVVLDNSDMDRNSQLNRALEIIHNNR